MSCLVCTNCCRSRRCKNQILCFVLSRLLSTVTFKHAHAHTHNTIHTDPSPAQPPSSCTAHTCKKQDTHTLTHTNTHIHIRTLHTDPSPAQPLFPCTAHTCGKRCHASSSLEHAHPATAGSLTLQAFFAHQQILQALLAASALPPEYEYRHMHVCVCVCVSECVVCVSVCMHEFFACIGTDKCMCVRLGVFKQVTGMGWSQASLSL